MEIEINGTIIKFPDGIFQIEIIDGKFVSAKKIGDLPKKDIPREWD